MSNYSKEVISDEKIFEKVKTVIVEALGVNENDVVPEASLVDDLGAESIDFLDINFRIERAFNIRLPRNNFLEEAKKIFGEESLEKNGSLTELGAKIVRERMPEIGSIKIKEGTTIEEISALFNVQTWCRLVSEMINSIPQNCIKCGSDELVSETQVTLKCNKCGENIALSTGDDIVNRWLMEFHKNNK